MKRTGTYRLTRFEQGDIYSARADLRRFVTIDYNLETYIGIAGNGVISGWEIETVSNKIIKITPGSGFINGFYSETPYYLDPSTNSPFRKSEAEALGYDVFEEIPGWSSESGRWDGTFYKPGGSPPEDGLIFTRSGPDGEDKDNDGIVDGVLSPNYDDIPPEHLSDPYVKSVSSPTVSLILPNDADVYIYAQRQGMLPHETFVSFGYLESPPVGSSRVLLGRVSVRNGIIIGIDTSEVQQLAGFYSKIAKLGSWIIKRHKHGGEKLYDPPRVRLDTDIRDCHLSSYSQEIAVYAVKPAEKTGESIGHHHTYSVNALGNGYTSEVIGSNVFHYHPIDKWVVKSHIANYGVEIDEHTHLLSEATKTWDDGTPVKVYVNDAEVSPSSYTVDASKGIIIFKPGVASVHPPLYSATYAVNFTETRTFTRRSPSIKNFILSMVADYTKYSEEKSEILKNNAMTSGTANVSAAEYFNYFRQEGRVLFSPRNPFSFFNSGGFNYEVDERQNWYRTEPTPVNQVLPIDTMIHGKQYTTWGLVYDTEPPDLVFEGFNNIDEQATMAASILKFPGDEFTLLPRVARFVTISLQDFARIDKVKIEILNNVEVTGQVSLDNMFFVRAEKFNSGGFKPVHIPFLSHVGRLMEQFRPRLFSTYTEDGVKFIPVARTTSTSSGHSHRIYLDGDGDGSSLATLVDNKITVWKEIDGVAARITHSHSIVNGKVLGFVSDGINYWQKNNPTDVHSHKLDFPMIGAAKSVFSVIENETQYFIGTSDGLLILSSDPMYRFVIGGYTFYEYGQDMFSILISVISRYEKEMGFQENIIREVLLLQANQAQAVMTSVGTSFSFSLHGGTLISITRVSYIREDRFFSEKIVEEDKIEPGWSKIREVYDVVLNLEDVVIGEDWEPPKFFLVRKFFDSDPVWGLVISNGKIYACQPTRILRRASVGWEEVTIPIQAKLKNKIISDANGDLWIGSNVGLLVSRWNVSDGLLFTFVSQTEIGYHVYDLTEAANGIILVAGKGMLKRVMPNNIITTVLAEDVRMISKDHDTGTCHCVLSSGQIYKSTNNGETWFPTGKIDNWTPQYGPFWSSFGNIYIGTPSITLMSSDDGINWATIPTGILRSCAWSEDMSSVLLGGDNKLLVLNDNGEFSTVLSFLGDAIPLVYIDEIALHYGFAYRNGTGIFLRTLMYLGENIRVSTSYDVWESTGGSWNQEHNYDILIDGDKIISSKDSIDLRGVSPYNFLVSPQDGKINFGVHTPLTSNAMPGDTSISADTSGFSTGDTIMVSWEAGSISTMVGGERITTSWEAGYLTRILTLVDTGLMTFDEPIPSYPRPRIPSTISLISCADSKLDVRGNFYDGWVTNSGSNTHDEIENVISTENIGLPMRLGDSYSNNLSELIIAVKYGIPDADSAIRNFKAFMMRYSRDPLDDGYIDKHFDVSLTARHTGSIYDSKSKPVLSNSINAIAIGYGKTKDIIFAGTDSGLFIATLDDAMESNWIPVFSFPGGSVTDIVVLGNGSVCVASPMGIYLSNANDLASWTKRGARVTDDKSVMLLAPRWSNFNTKKKYWWNSWMGMTNLIKPNITNTLIAGGENILVKSRSNGSAWQGIPMPWPGLTPKALLPISNGTAIMGFNSFSGVLSTRVGITNDDGDNWRQAIRIPGLSGTIISTSVTEYYNTNVLVTFHHPEDKILRDNAYVGLFFISGQWSFKIAANHGSSIILMGTSASELLLSTTTFYVTPPQVISAGETKNQRILVGTTAGLLEDRRSHLNSNILKGIVTGVNKEAVISAIDISGEILSISSSGDSSTLTCNLNRNIQADGLIGRKLYLTSGLAPSVSILSPIPGEVIGSTSVTVSISTISFVVGSSGYLKLTLDGSSVILTKSLYTFTGVSHGAHTLSVQLLNTSQTPLSNLSSIKTIVFSTSVPSTNPGLEIRSPVEGQIIKSGSFTTIVRVVNFNTINDGHIMYSLDGLRPISVAHSPGDMRQIKLSGMAEGRHSIETYLTDRSFSPIGVSIIRSFSVTTSTNPSIQINSPTSGALMSSSQITIQYSTNNFSIPDNGSIKVIVDNNQSFIHNISGGISISGLNNGEHVIELKLVDLNLREIAGEWASDTVSFTVSLGGALPPLLMINSPSNRTEYPPGTSNINIYYQTSHFDVGSDGGFVIGVNGVESYSESQSPYSLPIEQDGEYSITMTLADKNRRKFENSESRVSITIGVGVALEMGLPLENPQGQQGTETIPVVTDPFDNITEELSSSTTSDGPQGGFSIISNSSSSLSGSISISIRGRIPSSVSGSQIKIVGDTSIVYVDFIHPVKDGEFNGGHLYVDIDDQISPLLNYGIISNTKSHLILNRAVQSPEADLSNGDLTEGQLIRLIPPSGQSIVWVEFQSLWGTNLLAGETVVVNHQSGDISRFNIVSNKMRSIVLPKTQLPSLFRAGDELELTSMTLVPMNSFHWKKTSEELDHSHEVNLITGFISGNVSGMGLLSSTLIEVTVSSSNNLDNNIVAEHPDLLRGAKVIFYRIDKKSVVYEQVINEVYSNRLILEISNEGDWNFDGSNPDGIGTNFLWEIDASSYGITTNTIYNSIVTINRHLISDGVVGGSNILVSDTSGIIPGDSVELCDSTMSTMITSVISVPDITSVVLADTLLRTFTVLNGATLRIRRNSFIADHKHFINACEVKSVQSEELASVGYNYEHSHVLSDLIQSVSSIITDRSGAIHIAGSDSKIYQSLDYGQSWNILVDINDHIEGANRCESVTKMVMGESEELIIGTDKGYLLVQATAPSSQILELDVLKLQQPISSSSSSEQKNNSSSSSYSSSS